MAKLSIKTKLNKVIIVGDFCNWDFEKSIVAERQPKQKYICVEHMPRGEYKVFSCKSFQSGEIYYTDGRPFANRYFNGEEDEKIFVYFN